MQVTGIEPALFQLGRLAHHHLCVTCSLAGKTGFEPAFFKVSKKNKAIHLIAIVLPRLLNILFLKTKMFRWNGGIRTHLAEAPVLQTGTDRHLCSIPMFVGQERIELSWFGFTVRPGCPDL